jgi:hypothetical protein
MLNKRLTAAPSREEKALTSMGCQACANKHFCKIGEKEEAGLEEGLPEKGCKRVLSLGTAGNLETCKTPKGKREGRFQ